MNPKAQQEYDSSTLEVLTGLEPVRKRPGMYTDTTSPNHLAQEVIDNSVDEALMGQAQEISVHLNNDGSLVVTDNGRGMPVDIHPDYDEPGVELILTRLHSGAKFSDKNYRFSGGLHGVGVSVVNALSSYLKVEVWRGDKKFEMEFKRGEKRKELAEVKKGGDDLANGTRITFVPNPDYFDSPKFSETYLKHSLRAKAMLCQGLRTRLQVRDGKPSEWFYRDGMKQYISGTLREAELLPQQPIEFAIDNKENEFSWAVLWDLDGGQKLAESYVNLIPTLLGGSHINHFRTGLYEGMREFCDYRKLIPRDIRLTSEDIWVNCNYVLSVKLNNPHFSGQTKERLVSKEQTSFITAQTKDAFSNWLNGHSKQAGEACQPDDS